MVKWTTHKEAKTLPDYSVRKRVGHLRAFWVKS